MITLQEIQLWMLAQSIVSALCWRYLGFGGLVGSFIGSFIVIFFK